MFQQRSEDELFSSGPDRQQTASGFVSPGINPNKISEPIYSFGPVGIILFQIPK